MGRLAENEMVHDRDEAVQIEFVEVQISSRHVFVPLKGPGLSTARCWIRSRQSCLKALLAAILSGSHLTLYVGDLLPIPTCVWPACEVASDGTIRRKQLRILRRSNI